MSLIEKSFVTRRATHFCFKCGWIDELEVPMERRVYRESDGKDDISYYHIKTDKPMTCTDCKKTSVLPMTMANTPLAVEYLLKALR